MRKRKALSPIVSSVLVLAVAISLVSIYAQWAPNYAERFTGEIADNREQDIRCSNAGFSIRSASYDKSGEVIRFELENTGTIRFNQELYASAINGSNIITRTEIESLDVEEKLNSSLDTEQIPETLQVSSSECPDVVDRQDSIKISQ